MRTWIPAAALLTAILFAHAPGYRALAAEGDGETVPKVYIIPFKGEVELGLVHVIERGYREAAEAGADCILIEMGTPGGRVDAALDIIDLILDSEIPTAIYVTEDDATSAGAIISIAAEKIFMKEGSQIGTAAPVLVGGGGESEAMNAKTLSYVKAKVRSICEQRGFPEEKTRIFEAMVDKEIEIPDPDDPEKFITQKGELLTMTSSEALDAGVIDGVTESRGEVLAALGMENAEIAELRESPFEQLARFLSSMQVSSLLLALAVLGLFWEFRTPGFGLPGIAGAAALILFFWGHSIAGLTGWEVPILFGLGILLVSLEAFVIPGFGLTGILGFFCIFASLLVTLMDRPPTNPHFWGTFEWGELYTPFLVTSISVMAGLCLAFLAPFLFPAAARTEVGSWLMLKDSVSREKGYQSAKDGLDRFKGMIGVAKTPLRPAGIAYIDGERLDVVSQGGFVPANSTVEVVKVEGRRIVVRKA